MLTKSDIAEFSDESIRRMATDGLVQAIEVVQPSQHVDSVSEMLWRLDRTVLEQLTFKARWVCRRQGY